MPKSKYSAGLEGKRFNRTVIRAFAFRRPSGNTYSYYWICLCDCGTWHIADARSLFRGHVQSCRCFGREPEQRGSYKHGHSCRGKTSREFKSWEKMRRRIDDPDNEWYHRYGGRGIRYCQGFREFAHFLKILGPRPRLRTVDRVDNDWHYSCGECNECLINQWPMNVRWATIDEQNGNKSNSVILELDGRRQALFLWAKELGISKTTLAKRLKSPHWTLRQALTTRSLATSRDPAIPDLQE